MNHARLRYASTFISSAVLTLTLAGGGCGGMKFWGGPSADVAVVSARTGAALKPRFTTVVYRSADESTIDVYLTDLPLSRLQDGGDSLEGLSGSVVHVALFLQPSAGKTPIDPTACTGAVRQLVVADGAMGMYGGGAFITTADPGKETLSGSVRGGTVRLTRASANFNDLLGPASMEGKFTARYDDAACRAIAQRLQDASLSLPAIKSELK
ncbi:MAG: hypothetical protein Q8L55_15710 [Phycisphaerales bacterium]|nr:hypothetical protein [Phycisphaerales bacterium]